MALAVDGHRRFLVRSFRKAEDLASGLVEPVAVIDDPLLVLNILVLPVGIGHRLCGQPFNGPVVVHE
jgi:hypothetical protein